MKQTEKTNYYRLAFCDGTPKKALMTALVVGSILTTINHGDVILKGEPINYFKILLTYFVPFCVTTWGAIQGKRGKLL